MLKMNPIYWPALERLAQHADHAEPGEDAGEEAVRQGVLAAAEEGTSALLQLLLEVVQGGV